MAASAVTASRPDALRCLAHAAGLAQGMRGRVRPLHPTADTSTLRRLFGLDLPDAGRDGIAVLDDLVRAAEPGLVGNTEPGFFAWVMGGSHPVGVAADWLTAAWGQNAAIFQTAPAAAVAEEVAGRWLLDLLALPPDCGVGFTTGATMAAFTCLAAARGEVLRRAGHDFDRDGLQGAPRITILVSDDAHVSNLAALRFLGFGAGNLTPVETDDQGVIRTAALEAALARQPGPTIVVCQAGHINSGAFDSIATLADLAQAHGAWLHVDGAFGLWARAVPELAGPAEGAERADSWAVDGHKWLQVPYDSGFAIVRDEAALKRAMDITASYLTQSPDDGRNPTQYNPELSRRARGFAVWAVLQTLGRQGVAEMIRRHCACAARIAERCRAVAGIEVVNRVTINQVVLAFRRWDGDPEADALAEKVARALNDSGRWFVRTAGWKGRRALRISVISRETGLAEAEALADDIAAAWTRLRAD